MGFIDRFREELPMEYAVELNALLKIIFKKLKNIERCFFDSFSFLKMKYEYLEIKK